MNTDVVILGMPSSGKTVFLSVLGHKYNLTIDEGSPLGFRMYPRGEYTRQMVETNFSMLSRGQWPNSTNRGQKTDLEWDVFTGNRKIFSLSSMDISGETFREAFGKMGTSSKAEADDALLGESSSTANGAYTAAQLREAVENAKCICLFLNISTEQNEKQRVNFEEAMIAMCNMLDRDPGLRQKTIVVLTQTHAQANEIERAGGAASFLKSNSSARDLYVIVKNNHIPVIAVSAVNENAGVGNKIPKDFKSDGLFGFLLAVSGMVAPESMGNLKDAYLHFLSAKASYYQNPLKPICSRVKLARKFAETGKAFYGSCRSYLDNPSNFEMHDTESEDASVILQGYYTQTEDDKEIVGPARDGWKTRLEYDEIWNRHLEIALQERSTNGTEFNVAEIIDAVRDEAHCQTDPLLFGFSETDLKNHGELESYEDWVEQCLKEGSAAKIRKDKAQADEDRKRKVELEKIARQAQARREQLRREVTMIAAGVVVALLVIRKLVGLCLASGNEDVMTQINQMVHQGEYTQAASTIEKLHDTIIFGVRARDYVPRDTGERLRSAAQLTPVLGKLQSLTNSVFKVIKEAQTSKLILVEDDDDPLVKGVKAVRAIEAPDWAPRLPSLTDFKNGNFAVDELKTKLDQCCSPLEKELPAMRKALNAAQTAKAGLKRAEEAVTIIRKSVETIKKIVDNANSQGLFEYDDSNSLAEARDLLRQMQTIPEPPALIALYHEEANATNLVGKIVELANTAAQIESSANSALDAASAKKEWNPLQHECTELLRDLRQSGENAVNSNAISDKCNYARACHDTADKISEKIKNFSQKHPQNAYSDSARDFLAQTDSILSSLPYLVQIIAVRGTAKIPVSITENTWFGLGIPSMQNGINSRTERQCIYMLVNPDELEKSYKIPVKINGVNRKSDIELSTGHLHHGLNIFEVED